jgi:DNA end-binding protein Ku
LPEAEEQNQYSPERGFWSGTISFGLVSIPVSLFPATRPNRFSLRMLGPKGSPLARRYVAPETGEPLEQAETVRGYEVNGGEHVVVTQEELDRLAPEKSRDINLRLFTDRNSISPLYFHRPYFLIPGGPSSKAYRLLAETMEKLDRVGIATFVMRGKEYLVAIFAENKILLAVTLRWADEIRSTQEIGLPEREAAPKDRIAAYAKSIDKQSAREIPRDKLHDKRVEALQALVKKKRARNEDVVAAPQEEVQRGEIVDIMDLLKRTLAATRRESAETGQNDATAKSKSKQPAPKKKSTSARKRSSRSRTAA